MRKANLHGIREHTVVTWPFTVVNMVEVVKDAVGDEIAEREVEGEDSSMVALEMELEETGAVGASEGASEIEETGIGAKSEFGLEKGEVSLMMTRQNGI